MLNLEEKEYLILFIQKPDLCPRGLGLERGGGWEWGRQGRQKKQVGLPHSRMYSNRHAGEGARATGTESMGSRQEATQLGTTAGCTSLLLGKGPSPCRLDKDGNQSWETQGPATLCGQGCGIHQEKNN